MRTIIFVITMLLGISLLGQSPNDAQHPYAQVSYSTTPSTNQYGIAWFQTVTLQNNHIQNAGYISVDYIKLIEEDISTGTETVLHIEDYNGSGSLSLNEGGLYERFPAWYYNGTYTVMTNSSRSGGFLTINVGQQPDKIHHFWGVRQFCTLGKRHKVEIRLLISGNVALQAGMDYWTNSTTTTPVDCKEAFYSNWYGNSDGQFITVKFPNYGQQNMFDRTDYGFYQNGKFYVSKNLVDFVGGTSVALLSDATDWQPELMTLNGNIYEYNTGNNYYSAQYYCFKINPSGSSFFVPQAVINNLVYPSDVVDNGQGGYNFNTSPQTTTKLRQIGNDDGISIYPNPAKTKIYFSNPEDVISINLYNSIGELVLSEKINMNNNIDISKLQSGFYLLIMTTLKGETTNRIIKE
ncbi:MAG: T9SS type A sorting domain-containing protein [Bacteroidales bacterium]|nr:T9SS type A sorting domain-containing protein [Bacteroidales bacterium]